MEIPWEVKYKFAVGGYHAVLKGFLEFVRDEYSGDAALKLYEKFCKENDRIKHLTEIILNAFKLEGNDAETMGKWMETWSELTGIESEWLEQSPTSWRSKVTECPWKTKGKDISDWSLIFTDIVAKTINPKLTVERPKAMCAGDPYCDYIYKMEE